MQTTISEYNNFHMNTEVNARVFGSNADAAISEARLVLVQLENLLNRYLPGSEINRINQYAGKTQVPISLATFEILTFAVELSQISCGFFDITVGPLVDLWNLNKSPCVPEARLIHQMLELVDYNDIQLNLMRKTVGIRRSGQSIDLGGIAKGYASDRVIQKVQQLSVSSAYINIGGNVSTLGNKPDGSTWRVGIRHPRQDGNLLGAVEVSNKAVVTSGDYERYFLDKHGKRWHHILNPVSGCPAESGLISVTVIADNAMTADGLSTALFVAGLENGLGYLAQFPRVESVFVDDHCHVFITQGLKGCFQTADGISYSIL